MIKNEYIIISKFNNKLTKSAIKINNIIIFKSNKVVSKGQDKLTFFDLNSKQIFTTNIDKQKYSFVYSQNGLTLMNNNKILLCACKKYLKFQKNGILLLSFKDDKNINNNCDIIDYKFYCTNNFEVYCFCPISIVHKKEIMKIKSDKKDTSYFFVGGFDLKRNKGMIKLYKVIYNEEYNKNKIQYVDDIKLIDEKKMVMKFNGPISCITQSNIDGKIIITCWNGNIYLFDHPNISNYL